MKNESYHERIEKVAKNVLFALLVLAITGCVSMPTREQATTADYGSYPVMRI